MGFIVDHRGWKEGALSEPRIDSILTENEV